MFLGARGSRADSLLDKYCGSVGRLLQGMCARGGKMEAGMEGPATGDATTARLGAPLEPSAAGDAGALVLGRYRLLERIGAGGFGVVWAALDERLQREVAVKVVPRERGAHGARAEREALAAARLNHPGIVALYELGSDDERVYLVSELVAGGTLGELARAGSLSDRDVARIGVALCDALAHAHARGVIHRDVKPQNVLVVDEPAAGAGFAKLTDFGVAHLATGDALTGTGDVVGTLAYMAPEQAEGARVTPAADVYSLALTLYELWTGSNPVRAGTPAATAG
jgi:eukaryotic-like serine/threonine-protein kinase